MKRKTPLRAKTPLRSSKGLVPGTTERPRARINPIGKGAKRIAPEYLAAKKVMYARAGGKCERCDQRCEPGSQDPHHVFGRSHLIPVAIAYLPESLLALCRPCHELVGVDPEAREDCRWISLHLLAWRWGIEALDYHGKPLDILREWIRLGFDNKEQTIDNP